MRTRSLTTKSILIYKVIISVLLAIPFTIFVISAIEKRGFWELFMSLNFLLILYKIWKKIKILREVSYNNESLFVKQNDFEVQIPFYQISNVELISLDGIYKFELYESDQFGDTVLCKPSMWYPITYKKVDHELHVLRDKITLVKNKYRESISEGPIVDVGMGLTGMKI